MNKNDVIHIVITPYCKRSCKYCCNNEYDLEKIPFVTEEELRNTDTICLTGGEPFSFTNPNEYAKMFKRKYPNIKNVYVYSNAKELNEFLKSNSSPLDYLDGISCSIKIPADLVAFTELVFDGRITDLKSNLLYVFDKWYPPKDCKGNFKVIDREWQISFTPADNSIFRRV